MNIRALCVAGAFALFVLPSACGGDSGGGGGEGGAAGAASGGSGGGGAGGKTGGASGSAGGAGGSAGATGGAGAGGGGAGGAAGGAGTGGGGVGGGPGGAAGGNAGAAAGAGGTGGVAGGGGAAGTAGAGGGGPMPSGKGVFVTVGENGRHVRSLDLGKTWVDPGNTADTLDNVAWGKGLFFGGTHDNKIYSSPDGKTWTPAGAALNQWVGGVAYGQNLYVAVGGYGQSWFSTDGMTWMNSPTFRDGGEAARSLAFRGGTFTAATDPGNWWTSADGKTWTKTTGGHTSDVVTCGNAFSDRSKCTGPEGHGQSSAFGEGVWVAIVNGGVERSEDAGKTWAKIAAAGTGLRAVGFGTLP